MVNRVTRWNCVVSFYNDKWSILNISLKCEETTSSGWRDCLKPPQANTYHWLSVSESTCLHLLLHKAITTSDHIYKIMYKKFPSLKRWPASIFSFRLDCWVPFSTLKSSVIITRCYASRSYLCKNVENSNWLTFFWSYTISCYNQQHIHLQVTLGGLLIMEAAGVTETTTCKTLNLQIRRQKTRKSGTNH